MNRKDREIKKHRKQLLKRSRKKYVHWKCVKCGRIADIQIGVNNADAYTDEKEKKFICCICR